GGVSRSGGWLAVSRAGRETLPSMTTRVSTGSPKLDEMLGGGLLPGTLTVAYGATGIGKTHRGLGFCHQGWEADGEPGIVFDMNARGDFQQPHAYAARVPPRDLA